MKSLSSNKKHEKGQGLTEYALILSLVSVFSIVVLALFGPAIGRTFNDIYASLSLAGGEEEAEAPATPTPEPAPTEDPYLAWQNSMRALCNSNYSSYPSKGVSFEDHGSTVRAVCIYGDGWNTPGMATIGTYTK